MPYPPLACLIFHVYKVYTAPWRLLSDTMSKDIRDFPDAAPVIVATVFWLVLVLGFWIAVRFTTLPQESCEQCGGVHIR